MSVAVWGGWMYACEMGGERLSIEECMVVSSWVMWRNVWM